MKTVNNLDVQPMKSIINKAILYSIILAYWLVLQSTNAAVQQRDLNREQVKVAYIFNFVKHISWPEEVQKKEYVLAVYNDNDFFKQLKRTLMNRQVKDKPIHVILVGDARTARKADLLYIPNNQNKKLAQLANAVRGSSTLLVTDNSDDKHNAMLNLTDNHNSSALSFEVNKSNIVYEKLTISRELLLLGGTEIDVATLYRETEKAMQDTRIRESALNSKIAKQEQLLHDSSALLTQLNANLTRSRLEISHQKNALKTLNEQHNAQKKSLLEKEQRLSMILPKLAQAEDKFNQQRLAAKTQEQEIQQMALQIADKKNILEQQKASIVEQKANIEKQSLQLNQQMTELANSKKTINSQKTTIVVTLVIVGIAISVVILIVLLFIKNKKTTQKLSETLEYLKDTQDQLIQSEKMASLGALIAGVAHEINTPLGIAVTSTSLIKDKTEEIAEKLTNKKLRQSELKAFVDIAIQSVDISNKGLERVIVLLNNFKQVAADQIVEQVRKVNIAEYIEEVMTTLGNELKKHKVKFQLSGTRDIEIETIPGAFAQVITNLVTNSIRHGFENREMGNITIEIDVDSHNQVVFIYKDDGIGMKPEVLAQVFDPFFTTKRNRGGTGLGMNIVYNIVQQKLLGKITVNSLYEQGMSCTVALPKRLESQLSTPTSI